MNVYSIKDETAKYFMQPFYARNHGEAIRSFANAVNDHRNPDNLLAKHPSTFALYWIGAYDEDTGRIDGLNTDGGIDFIGHGTDFTNKIQ